MKDEINMGMNIPAVKGHCKIELFENGEKVKEIEQDNYVHPKYLGALNKIYSYGAFEFVEEKGEISSRNTIGQRGGEDSVPFRGIVMTDFEGVEAPDVDRAIRGKIVAMCSINDNNSQQSPVKGRYNKSESEHTLNHHKFVYEFREDEANGVIGSIYTTPSSTGSASTLSTDRLHVFTQSVNSSNIPSTHGVAHIDEKYIYMCDRSWSTPDNSEAYEPNIVRIEKEKIPNINDRIVAETIHMPVRPIKKMTEYNGRIYMMGFVRHSRDTDVDDIPADHTFVISSPKNDLASYRVEKLWNLGEMADIFNVDLRNSGYNASKYRARYIASMGDMVYDGENNEFIVIFKHTDSNQSPNDFLYRFDTSFNVIEATGGVNDEEVCNLYDSNTIMIRDIVHELSEVSNTDTRIRFNDYTEGWSALGSTSSVRPYNDFFDITKSQSSRFTFTPAAHFFSRVRLAQPINKTNQQTMKITYEFTREPFSLDHIDDGSKYTPCAPEIIQ